MYYRGQVQSLLQQFEKKELVKLAELDDQIRSLVWEVNFTSREESENIAFIGLCNYSLAFLGPALTMEVYGKDFNRGLIQFLCFFWTEVAKDFYEEIAMPHEDVQILKNGDCEVFTLTDEKLKITTA